MVIDEHGDNSPGPTSRRDLVPRFRQRFAHYFTRTRSGKPRYPDHPKGPHASTAYAGRPRARRPADHPRPLRHHPRAGPDGSRPGPADLAAQRAPQGQARQGAVDHRPGPRADPRAGAPPRLERAAPRRRRRLAGLEALRSRVDLYLAGEARRRDRCWRRAGSRVTASSGRAGSFQFGLTNGLLPLSTTTSSYPTSATTTSGTATPGRASARRSAMEMVMTRRTTASARLELGHERRLCPRPGDRLAPPPESSSSAARRV